MNNPENIKRDIASIADSLGLAYRFSRHPIYDTLKITPKSNLKPWPEDKKEQLKGRISELDYGLVMRGGKVTPKKAKALTTIRPTLGRAETSKNGFWIH